MGGRMETGIEFKVLYFDTILNYWLSQKLRLLGNYEFNHLTIILTTILAKMGDNWVCLALVLAFSFYVTF